MSNTNRRIGNRIPSFFNRQMAPGQRVEPGAYIGKIKNNVDPARWGRLQVFIPQLGGIETDSKAWWTVNYASPFFGATSIQNSTENNWESVAHTYGMWYTVPDVDNFVLVMFVNGDPDQGYWFACLPNQFGHHMVPAMASSTNIDVNNIQDPQLQAIAANGAALPVAEFNENLEEIDWSTFTERAKPLHEFQARILVNQGLDRIALTSSRGIIFSTTQRESPSGVFGVSTPGRIINQSTVFSPDLPKYVAGTTRTGGHSFVMDDGDIEGANSLVRLRTSKGHQILFDDSNDIVYVINSQGTTWLEMTGSGHVNVYAGDSLNIRTGGDINLHADQDININANGSFNVLAKQNIKMQSNDIAVSSKSSTVIYGNELGLGSSGELNISASGTAGFTVGGVLKLQGDKLLLNSGAGETVAEPADITQYKHAETKPDSNQQWQVEDGQLQSASRIVPTHEPWPRTSGTIDYPSTRGPGSSGRAQPTRDIETTRPAVPVVIENFCGDYFVRDSSGNVVRDSSGQPVLTSEGAALDPGPQAALFVGVTKKLPKSWMTRPDAPNPGSGVGPLSVVQVKALMSQIAYTESAWASRRGGSRNNYLGRYQFGAPALSSASIGFIKPEAVKQYGNDAVNYPGSWTGKMGINSAEDYLKSSAAQEFSMIELLKLNYAAMTRNGAIKNGDNICCVGGMLAVAHLIGAGDDPQRKLGAKYWRRTGGGADAFNTSGTTYYNRGRYAVHDLAG
jgi:hypothetical protein